MNVWLGVKVLVGVFVAVLLGVSVFVGVLVAVLVGVLREVGVFVNGAGRREGVMVGVVREGLGRG